MEVVAAPVEVSIPEEEPLRFDHRRALRMISHAVRRRNAQGTPIEHRFTIALDIGR